LGLKPGRCHLRTKPPQASTRQQHPGRFITRPDERPKQSNTQQQHVCHEGRGVAATGVEEEPGMGGLLSMTVSGTSQTSALVMPVISALVMPVKSVWPGQNALRCVDLKLCHWCAQQCCAITFHCWLMHRCCVVKLPKYYTQVLM
jgi:hypothetical protein